MRCTDGVISKHLFIDIEIARSGVLEIAVLSHDDHRILGIFVDCEWRLLCLKWRSISVG